MHKSIFCSSILLVTLLVYMPIVRAQRPPCPVAGLVLRHDCPKEIIEDCVYNAGCPDLNNVNNGPIDIYKAETKRLEYTTRVSYVFPEGWGQCAWGEDCDRFGLPYDEWPRFLPSIVIGNQ